MQWPETNLSDDTNKILHKLRDEEAGMGQAQRNTTFIRHSNWWLWKSISLSLFIEM